MNNLPIVLYSCALFAVWLYSCIRSMVALLCGEAAEALLASPDGVRWFLRSSVDSVGRVPWAMIVVLLMCSGVLYSCGLFSTVNRLLRGGLSMRMRRALWSLLVAVVIMALFVLFSSLYPLNIFRSISGDFASSPVAEGWPLLLFVALFFLSAVFGVVGGAFKGVDDIVGAVSSRIKFHASSMVALVPGALLLASLEYEGLMPSGNYSFYFEYFVILFPFACRLLFFDRNSD